MSHIRTRSQYAAMVLLLCADLFSTVAFAGDGGRVRDYFDSTTSSVSAFLDVHTRNAPAAFRNEVSTLWTELALNNYVSLTDSLRFETDLVIHATLPNQQSGTFPSIGKVNPKAPFVDFRTFMLTWEGTNTQIRFGKGVIEMGHAELYSPVDRFNTQNYSKPQHFNDRGDLQLSISRYFGADTLSFTVLPFNEDFIDPPGNSRWLNSQGDRDFFDESGTKDEERPHSFPEDWGYLLQYAAVREGYDFYVAAHYGPGAYPIIQLSGQLPAGWCFGCNIRPDALKTYPRAISGMAGFVTTAGSWSFYTDLMYQETEGREDDSFGRWTVGFSYRGTQLANRLGIVEIKPVMSYSGETVRQEYDPSLTLHNSESARPHPDSLLGRLELQVTDTVLVHLNASTNLEDDDGAFSLGVIHNVSDSLLVSATGFFMRGKDGTQFGRWRHNDFVTLGLSYRF